jgi:hypothetical protein
MPYMTQFSEHHLPSPATIHALDNSGKQTLKQVEDSYGFVPCMQVNHELGSKMFVKPASTNQPRTSSEECTP